MTRLSSRARATGGDEGLAMIMVIGTMVIMSILVAVALTVSSNFSPIARKDQDWNAALAAAQAGVDDYLANLNRTDTYWATVDCANVALKGPKPAGQLRLDRHHARGLAAGPRRDRDERRLPLRRRHLRNLEGGVGPPDVDRKGERSHAHDPGPGLQGRVDRIPLLHRLRGRRPGQQGAVPERCEPRCGGSSNPSDWKYFWQTRRGCSEITFIGGDVLDGRRTSTTPR